jgi:Bacterial membrane protein YfhO
MAKDRKPSLRKKQESSLFSSLTAFQQDLLSVAFLFAVTLFLFRGIIFNNAAFSAGGDTAAALSYQKAGQTIKDTQGIDPLWMPYFFSGMPTFGNVAYVPHNVSYLQTAAVAVLNLLYLNGTWTWLVVFYFLSGVFMFFLMRIWHTSRLAALIAALTFMLSPYGIGLAGEGHGSKLMALSYLPLVFLLTHLVFEKRNLLSFGLLATAIGTLLLTNHMQIVYYDLMVVGLYLLYHVVRDARKETLLAVKKILLFAGALLIGFMISSYIYLSVYEYSTYSIRGSGVPGTSGGLTWDYATNWSWHPQELLTLLIPSFFGFQTPMYWGTMPFTNSTIYVGIIPILLSLLALAYRRNAITIFMALLTGIVFLISFGKHFPFFYQLLFDYFPFFNKFRTPAMILHFLAFTTAILGAFGFDYLVDLREKGKEGDSANLQKILMYVLYAIGALFILALVFRSSLFGFLSSFMFDRPGELEQYRMQVGQQAPRYIARLHEERFDLLMKDLLKFCVIAAVSAGAVLLYLRRTIRMPLFATAVVAILLVDLIIVINDGEFIKPKPSVSLDQSFQPGETVAYLKKQPGLFRIYPVADPYNDNTYAYHGLQSVGGYSPAKLKIYQEMVDSAGLYPPRLPLQMNILDMLNARYFVVPGRLPDPGRLEVVNVEQTKGLVTYFNPDALPRAWFVDTVVVAPTKEELFGVLLSPGFNPARTAVVSENLPEDVSTSDSTNVEVTSYGAHEIHVATYSTRQSLLVLSEIYYPAGWEAFIDGKATTIFRTNSILRSVIVPAGMHEIVFRFHPPLYEIGWTLSQAGWGLAALFVLIGLWRMPGVRAKVRGREREHGAG